MSKTLVAVGPSPAARRTSWMLLGSVAIIVLLLVMWWSDLASGLVLGLFALSAVWTGVLQLRSSVEVDGEHLKVAGSWRTELVPVEMVRDVTVVEARVPFWSWGRDWPPFRRTRAKDCLVFWVAPDHNLNPEATRRLAGSTKAIHLRDEFRSAIREVSGRDTGATEPTEPLDQA